MRKNRRRGGRGKILFLCPLLPLCAQALFRSLHDDVRCGEEHGDGGDDGEGCEGDEAEAVDHHGGELPVHDDLLLLVADLHPVGDELQLLQDALQLPVGGGGAAVGVRRRRRRARRRRRRRIGRRRGRRRLRLRRRQRSRLHPHPGDQVAVLLQRVAVHPDEPATAPHGCRHADAVAACGYRHRSETGRGAFDVKKNYCLLILSPASMASEKFPSPILVMVGW